MRDPYARALREHAARIEAAERRIAMSQLSGKVSKKDPEKRMVRLKLGTNSKGEDVLSPWMRWQEARTGNLKIHAEPADGEQMTMHSPSGVPGTASIAGPATYDKDHKAPSKSSDTTVLEAGGARLEMGPKGFVFNGNSAFQNGKLTHDDVNIGKDHVHEDVMTGSDDSGPVKP